MTKAEAILETLGRERCAAVLGVGRNQIQNVAKAGVFPARWYAAMQGLCLAQGVELPMSLFRWQRNTPARIGGRWDYSHSKATDVDTPELRERAAR